ncbi:hypothetical protein D9M73_155770 [compost metagenome]
MDGLVRGRAAIGHGVGRLLRAVDRLGGRGGGCLQPGIDLHQRCRRFLEAGGGALGPARQIFRSVGNFRGTGPDAGAARHHAADQTAQRGKCLIKAGFNCSKGRRHVRNVAAQIAIGQRGQGLRQAFDRLVAFDLCLFEIDRDRQFHVEQGRFDDRAARIGGARPAEERQQAPPRRQMPRNATEQIFEDQPVSADIPARFEADMGVDRANPANAGMKFLIERTRRNTKPVAFLRTLGMRHMLIVAEEGGGFRGSARAVIEAVQCRAE